MKNIFLILQREYLTRVRKKSFIVMTIIGPLMIAAMYAILFWAALSSTDTKSIKVIDDSGLFVGKFKNSESFNYQFSDEKIEAAKQNLLKTKTDALVYIPNDILENPKSVKIYSEKGVALELQSSVEKAIEQEIESIKLTEAGITRKVLADAKVSVNSETINLSEQGEKQSSAAAATGVGYFLSFLIYMAVLIYGAQVMRGVMEEKTNRIVEVVISSVKPFELMMGKILGVAMVGLTQFLLWIILSFGVLSIGGSIAKEKLSKVQETMQESQLKNLPKEAQDLAKQQMQQSSSAKNIAMPEVVKALETLPVGTILVAFILYFLGGYLLYSALFGAVGSAVDSETDTQQFMLPITIPILISIMLAQFVMRDPNGSLAFWASMVPFSSPIIMMVRIPFGVPVWQIALSITFLIAGFIFTTWVAARIYRIGILMYGKKATWKELSKWIFYKG